MKSRVVALAILFVMMHQWPVAQAQTQDASRLQAFTRTAFYAGFITKVLAGVPPAVFQKCPALVSRGSTVTIIKPVSFGDDGFPNSGTWSQSFPISGCGNDTTLHFYFSADRQERINTVFAVPGTSHADLVLQRDALFYANGAAIAKARTCKNFIVKNTKFEAFGVKDPQVADPGPGNPKRPWTETWTMVGCGRTFEVPLDFLPDATGTRIIQPGGGVEQ